MSDYEVVEEPSIPVQQDYFGFGKRFKFYLPDGVTYIEYKEMTEGDRAKFQSLTSRDMTLERRSGNARIAVNPAEERHALIKSAVSNWNLKRAGRVCDFSLRMLDDFLQLADPAIIDSLEEEIRKANPWLTSDMTVEDIDKEIENLQEMREEVIKRKEGESVSRSK